MHKEATIVSSMLPIWRRTIKAAKHELAHDHELRAKLVDLSEMVFTFHEVATQYTRVAQIENCPIRSQAQIDAAPGAPKWLRHVADFLHPYVVFRSQAEWSHYPYWLLSMGVARVLFYTPDAVYFQAPNQARYELCPGDVLALKGEHVQHFTTLAKYNQAL